MSEQYGVLQQAASNVVAHGMSSAEETKYRYHDADPEDLGSPLDALYELAAKRQRAAVLSRELNLTMGYVAPDSMMAD